MSNSKFNVILSDTLDTAFTEYCATHNLAKSTVARQAIAKYIGHLLTEEEYRPRPHRYYQTQAEATLTHNEKQLRSIRKALRNRESAKILDTLIHAPPHEGI